MNYKEATISQVASTVRRLRGTAGHSTAILIGAGASITGGIPIAKGMMEYMCKEYAEEISRCTEHNYTEYMQCLAPAERKRMINKYIKDSKINLAHFYLASLMSKGYTDVILTTNFDPLTIKSAVLFNQYPSIYDIAVSSIYSSGSISYPAIFFLHGQSHGFLQFNTEDELRSKLATIKKVISDTDNRRTWVIVGYSGNDPVMEQFLHIERFNENLYWVGFENEEPQGENLLRLLQKEGAYFVKGYNADSFFRKLHIQLGIDTPALLDKPFQFLRDMIDNISTENEVDGTRTDIAKEARGRIDRAIKIDNKDTSRLLAEKVKKLWLEDKYSELDTIYQKVKDSGDFEARKYLTYAYNDWGVKCTLDAAQENGERKEAKILEAIAKYEKAAGLKVDYHNIKYNWGNCLGNLAKLKTGKEQEEFYLKSFEKYEEATKLKSTDSSTWYNWGTHLIKYATTKTGKEKDNLYQKAFSYFEKATSIDPEKDEAWYNWGTGLRNLGLLKKGKEKERLYIEASKKYEKVINIRPNDHEAWYNLGMTLSRLAKIKSGKEKNELHILSSEKFEKATTLAPNDPGIWNSWGNNLILFANSKEGDEQRKLYLDAQEKLNKAEEVLPGAGAYNLACIYSLLNDPDKAFTWIEKDLAAHPLRARKEFEDDSDFDNIRHFPHFKEILEKYAGGAAVND